MRERSLFVYLTIVLILLISCIPKETLQSASNSKVSTTVQSEDRSARETVVKEEWMDKWETVIKAVKKEGRLTVYSTTGGEMRFAVNEAFKRKYGLETEFLVAKGAQIAERVASEYKAGIYLPDVYLGGAQSAITYLKPKGYLDSIEPLLILPEVKDHSLWLGREFPWIDKDHMVIGFVAQVNSILAINTNMVKPDEITSYKDLLKPKWKGKILMNDVTMTGTGGNWFGSVQMITGVEFMRELAKQEPVIITDYRLQLTWLAQGKYPILLAPHSGTLPEFEKAGAPVKGIIPTEGAYRTTSSGNIALFKRAPHPEAVKLFVNWLLSREGQKVYSQVLGYPSARLDIPPEGVDPDRILDPKINYVNGNTEENILKQEEQLKEAMNIFGHLKK